MVKLECDKCGKDCGHISYVVSVDVILNPNPQSFTDTGDIKLTGEKAHMRLCMCQDCYAKLDLPNIYSVQSDTIKQLENMSQKGDEQ